MSPKKTDHQYLSVTSILGVADKPALVPWSAGRTADEFLRDPEYWYREAQRDPIETRKRLTSSRFKPEPGRQLTATELGTQFHQAAENWAITGVKPRVVHPEVQPFLDRLEECFETYRPEWVASEMIVINRTYGFAGQCDGIWDTHKGRFLIDYKTASKTHDYQGQPTTPYPEVALQTAAYKHADIIIPWSGYSRERRANSRYYTIPEEAMERAVPMPDDIDGTLAIHVTTGWANPHELKCDQEEWLAFLHLLEYARWVNGRGKNAVGPIMTPPGRGDVHMAEGRVA